jgi:hypothetical protein
VTRRPPARVLWRRRLIALAALVALAALIAVLVLRSTAPPPDFTGLWAGSDPLLGSKRWHISRLQDDEFKVTGMSVGGVALERLRLVDGKLVANGDAGGASWSVSISSISDGNQLMAEYRSSEDAPMQRVRFTRVPTD